MKLNSLAALAGLALFLPAPSRAAANPFVGRWDITVTTPAATYPDWMEVTGTEGNMAVRIQPRSGSVRPVKDFKIAGSHLNLVLSPTATWELSLKDNQLSGVQKKNNETTAQLAGVRAPALKRVMPRIWTKPEPLFNGKDLTGWEPSDAANNHWVAQDSILLNEKHGANLRTTRKFDDFKLHIEYNCPEEGNSGIYLRGRYEVQVEYEKVDANDRFHSMGSVYGFLAPAADLPRTPGQWESFDITLVGRYLTIVRNGVTTIERQEIPGITGGALDSREGEPGPFYIQGDHTGGMKYRNITISVPKK